MAISKEDVITNLRAIVISSKGGLKLDEIKADYYETFGDKIPLEVLGCKSLEEFFKNNSQDFSIIGNRVTAVIKNSSLHIVSLVNRQQNARKKVVPPKLSSKKSRNLHKPAKSIKETNSWGQVRRINHNLANKVVRQNSREVVPPTLKQSIPKVKNRQNDTPKLQLNSEKTKDEKNSEVQSSKKSTVDKVNTDLKESSLNKNFNENKQEKEKNSFIFDDFEDLHISKEPQQKSKIVSKESINNKESCLNLIDGNASFISPFRRSLAKNSKEEILSAKRSAQIINENNNVDEDKQIKNKGLTNVQRYSNLLFGIEGNTNNNQFCMNTFQPSKYHTDPYSEVATLELAAKKAYKRLGVHTNFPGLFYDTEHVVKLRELCLQKNLPAPVFKSLECHPKNEPRYFICKVKIGEDILLSSYPVEVQDELSARDLAAKKAYCHIISGSKPSIAIPQNDNKTLSQIFDIIKTKEYGVWSNKLPILYMETYNEELQSGWFELVQNSPKFEIEKIEKVGFIIRASNCLPENEEEPPQLTALKVPESNQWEIYITNVVSSAEIWCRLIGKEYSEVYDSMMTKLELQPPTTNVTNPIVGNVYLINLEESWNRVKVTEVNSDQQNVYVFLIDVGVVEVVKISQLFYLQRQFFSVSPQALLLSLNELDCLAEFEELQSGLFNLLLGNTFIAEIVAVLNESGNACSVNLWDTSTDEDINVNLKLLDEMITKIKSPTLPGVGLVKEMFVSYIDDNGEVYLQSSKQNVQYVDYIISTKMKYSERLVSSKAKLDPKKLYVTRSNKVGLYYRAKLVKILDSSTVVVKFIDYGYEQQAAVDELLDLEETSLDLATIPSQVVRVKFSNLKMINSKILEKIRENILEQSVLVKIVQIPHEGTPCVELFKRSLLDGTLSSINNKIINYKQLYTEETATRKKSSVIGLENILSKNLPMPNIPPIGSYFNVFVTLAAHPGLFNVQPLSTKNELTELMFRLQEKCDNSSPKPLSMEEFKIGELYAVKHSDDFWYRAHAYKVISSSAFAVSLCDFGDFIIAPAEKLLPLPNEFKTFPYQAIRAYLAGIAPANKDWSAEDCVEFRELVIEKDFVSQVVEVNRDMKNPNHITLGLILVDTSTDNDIYIHQLLIEKKMAVLKS